MRKKSIFTAAPMANVQEMVLHLLQILDARCAYGRLLSMRLFWSACFGGVCLVKLSKHCLVRSEKIVKSKKSSNLRVWSTLKAPRGRTVQNKKIII